MSHSSRAGRSSSVPTAEHVLPPAAPTATGWIVFGGVLLVLVGVFHVVEGLVALLEPRLYETSSAALAVHLPWTAWSWWHIAIGALAGLAGIGLLTGAVVARAAAVLLAALSALTHLLFIGAQPVWSTIAIALDVAVVYAVVVHGRDLRTTSY